MTATLNGKAVSVDQMTMSVSENFLLSIEYHIDVDDVQKKTAMMQQIQSIVDQYKPALKNEAEEA